MISSVTYCVLRIILKKYEYNVFCRRINEYVTWSAYNCIDNYVSHSKGFGNESSSINNHIYPAVCDFSTIQEPLIYNNNNRKVLENVNTFILCDTSIHSQSNVSTEEGSSIVKDEQEKKCLLIYVPILKRIIYC